MDKNKKQQILSHFIFDITRLSSFFVETRHALSLREVVYFGLRPNSELMVKKLDSRVLYTLFSATTSKNLKYLWNALYFSKRVQRITET